MECAVSVFTLVCVCVFVFVNVRLNRNGRLLLADHCMVITLSRRGRAVGQRFAAAHVRGILSQDHEMCHVI